MGILLERPGHRRLGLALLAALLVAPLASHATHFRFGTVTWSPAGGNTVRAVVVNSWRRSAYTTGNGRCRNPDTLGSVPCSGADGLAGVGDIIVEFQGGTQFKWGDGSPAVGSPLGPLLYYVTSIDVDDDWVFAIALDPARLPRVVAFLEHTYPEPGSYAAALADCCRLSAFDPPNQHINNPDGEFRVESIVNAGGANRSPVGLLPPFVGCALDELCIIDVNGIDQDGDPLTYRMSTPREASGSPNGFIQPGPPFAPFPATIGPASGFYTWLTTNATVGVDPNINTLYSTQITLQDPTSKISVDFLVRLVNDSSDPPVVTAVPGEPRLCNSIKPVQYGRLLQFGVLAVDPDPIDSAVLNVVGLPFGAAMVPPLPVTGNPAVSYFNWIPAETQASAQGTPYPMLFLARSVSGLQTRCSVIVEVFTGKPCDIDEDDDVDSDDIQLIFDARDTPSDGPDDPRDIDSDGFITVLDSRVCSALCDQPQCAVPAGDGGS